MGGTRNSGGSTPATRAGGAPQAPTQPSRYIADGAVRWDQTNDDRMLEAFSSLGLEPMTERTDRGRWDYQSTSVIVPLMPATFDQIDRQNGWTIRTEGSWIRATRTVDVQGDQVRLSAEIPRDADLRRRGARGTVTVKVKRSDISQVPLHDFNPTTGQWERQGGRFGTRGGGTQSRG